MIIEPRQAFGSVSSSGEIQSNTDTMIPLAIIVTSLLMLIYLFKNFLILIYNLQKFFNTRRIQI